MILALLPWFLRPIICRCIGHDWTDIPGMDWCFRCYEKKD